MKTLARIAVAVVAAYGFMGFAADSVVMAQTATTKSPLPNGKPFQYLNSRIDALQLQIDALIGDVSSLKEWRVAAEAALLELQENSAANAAAIALLQSELDNVNSILDTKQDIITGTCPDGQYVYEITQSPAGLLCRADIGASGLVLDTVMVNQTIAANSSAIVSAECLAGTVVTGGSHEAGPGLQVNSSSIDGNGFTVDVANTTVDGIALNVTATCLGVAP